MATHTLSGLAKVRQVNEGFPYPEPIKQWKARGGKVIGWVCTYAPEELMHAAGLLPLRITGGFEQLALDWANAYLYPTTCSTVRSYVQLALEKRYDFLDGFVMAGTCDHIRRLYDVWAYYAFTPAFNHLIRVPGILRPEAEDYYRSELVIFQQALEDFTGNKITPDRLRHSINLFNRMRRLLGELEALKKLEAPPLTGAEMLEIMNAGWYMPKEEYIPLLEEILAEAKGVARPTADLKRIMIYGSELNNHHFVKFLEDQECLAVVMDTCTGYRYWSDLVNEDPDVDPLDALAQRYINHFPCSRIFPRKIRLERVMDLVREYRIQGVVSEYVRYCTPVAWERSIIRDRMEQAGIPVLQLEIEYGTAGTGQIKTRIRAFVEMLEDELAQAT